MAVIKKIKRQPRPKHLALHLVGAASITGWCAAAHGADADTASESALPQVVIVGTTPIPGGSIDIDKIPGNVQVLSSSDLARQGSPSLINALNSNASSININDTLDDPFQPDILYRGFEASPVLGTPQGLAVYQNGVRINEAFGDTVNWDLFPDVAIDQVELVSSSPLYGLNALGGAVSVTMKNGFTYQGGELEVSGGSYGQRSFVGQYGATSGPFGVYIAARALDWDGWRDFTSDAMRDLYAAFSLHTDNAKLDLGYTHADNVMHGQSPAPVQELAVNRSLVFTGPQDNINILNFLALNGTVKLTDGWSLHGLLYYRDFYQSVVNGNTTNYMQCQPPSDPTTLCQPDGTTPLQNAAGQTLPDISQGGSVTLGENDFEFIRSWSRGATVEISSDRSLGGLGNQFSAGVAADYASTSYYTGAQIGVINPQLLVLPSDLFVDTPEDSAAAIANGDATPVSVDSVNKNIGFYVTDTLDVTPDLAVTASGRYNIAHVNMYDQLGDNLDGYNRFVHFNPSIGATYKVLPTITLYGGLSVNTRTPTASELECANPQAPCLLPSSLSGDPPLRQVVSHTLELGLRGKLPASVAAPLQGELNWNVSVFRTNLHDDIFGIATSLSQGFFQNIGDTQREGVEAGFDYRSESWSAYANYSFVQATFRSSLVVPSPSNPFADANGDIQVTPGDRLPGIPKHRLKLGADYKVIPAWTVGASVNIVSSFSYAGDDANQLAPIPGYTVVNLFSTYRPVPHLELFATIDNLLNRKYATYGILSDPTGVGAPGVPANGVTNGPGVDNRFLSPSAPLEIFGGLRVTF